MAVEVKVSGGKAADGAARVQVSRRELAEAAVEACRRLLGVSAQPEPWAGAPPAHYVRRQLNSIRLVSGAATVIATRRRNAQLAAREADTLTALGAARAPAPRLLAAEGEWIMQEDVGRTRLSQRLQKADAKTGIGLLTAAAQALWRCHDAVRGKGFVAQAPVFDGTDRLMAAPAKLGKLLNAPAPSLPEDKVLALIRPPEAVFVKWDARTANAILDRKGDIFWIDWEEWGRRCRFDDLVWLVCDEWVPDFGRAEDEFIARQIRARADSFPGGLARAEAYVAAFGALHAILRVDILMRTKAAGDWWDEELAHTHDLIGVTRGCVARMLSRAGRLAAKIDVLAPLSHWVASLPDKLPA